MTPTAEEVKRAVEMLKVSARRSSIAAPSVTVRYDEAECDGYCVADDCEAAAEDLDSIVSSLRAENAALELSVAEAGGAFELCDRENERLRRLLRLEVEALKEAEDVMRRMMHAGGCNPHEFHAKWKIANEALQAIGDLPS